MSGPLKVEQVELLPCPFGCGPNYLGSGWGTNDGEHSFSVWCNRCGMTGPWDIVEDKAISAWNHRIANKVSAE